MHYCTSIVAHIEYLMYLYSKGLFTLERVGSEFTKVNPSSREISGVLIGV
jgi:hypothetical protein